MNKTIKELLHLFAKWLLAGLLSVSSLCNLGFWFYLGVAFWTHHRHYVVVAVWWFLATIPSTIVSVYAKILNGKKK